MATAPPPHSSLDHYTALDPLFRAAIGDRLHHGWWTDNRTPLAAAQATLEQYVAEAVLRFSPRRVLDIGCGYGRLARRLATEGVPSISGLNPNRTQLDYARSHTPPQLAPQLHWHSGHWPDAAPTLSPPFDLVLFLESLEHLPDPAAALSTACHTLQPGGHLVVCSCHPVHPSPHLQTTFRHARYHPGLPGFLTLSNLAKAVGLTLVTSADWTPFVQPTWQAIHRQIIRWSLRHPLRSARWLLTHLRLAHSASIGLRGLHHATRQHRLEYRLSIWQFQPQITTAPTP